MRILATCPLGLESILKKEIERIDGKILETRDKSVLFEGDYMTIARANLWSRVGNKVYLELACGEVKTFDDLYALVQTIDWGFYLQRSHPIHVSVTSIKSLLTSVPAIQSITKKSIVSKKLKGREGILPEDQIEESCEISVLLRDNFAQILLNTSGEPLHKRGYRTYNHEAPLKENLAAGLILLSNWRFSEPFYDPFCGSGTIAIEAAMIARNIAPGSLGRKFAISRFPWFPREILSNAKYEAEGKKILDKKYQIFASDIDETSLDMTYAHAQNAGVVADITIENHDFSELLEKPLFGTLVGNPPYGVRLQPDEISSLYADIAKIFIKNEKLTGGIITSLEEAGKIFASGKFKNRKLYNGGDLCYFYSKK